MILYLKSYYLYLGFLYESLFLLHGSCNHGLQEPMLLCVSSWHILVNVSDLFKDMKKSVKVISYMQLFAMLIYLV